MTSPTKARLAVLAGVQRGEVQRHRRWMSTKPDYDVWTPESGKAVRVTARVEELLRAGWIRRGPATGPSMYAPQVYEITGEGERVLTENGGQTT